ncbi:cysteine--tRNA ligase [uncultured Ferrovibrio sp.]|jgi:cysteinyl-tRNA synthetase|uniref:cysteine--tRNA ligase n=1 Tax=uncultured Ferrovibrio sp. TaxID=1576913 RepID=UPI00260AA1B5|nr:cysteine--tRNA ligase [uncultured Ferrovibrio sp.]
MQIQLYNTLTRQKEVFVPRDPQRVTMYVCGPTVYNFAHIGNARPVVVFDTLYRLLQRQYPTVVYVRNVTDVDDKINAAAKAEGVPISTITERYHAVYSADMAALGALPPVIEPKVTQHIPAIISMIERLIANGHAYAAEGHVLFNVPSFKDYGQLSRRDRDEMIAGARVDVAPYKRDPADFVLWKPSPPDLPGWDSPWGRGRPGWHIECSAMIEKNLGTETIDIHGGGHDLIFPHHENEIAQSTCAHGGTMFCRYWLHNGFVNVDAEKMSKSLGNVLLVHDLLTTAPGEAIRLALLSAHYRQPLDWTDAGLRDAKAQLDRLYRALDGLKDVRAADTAAPEAFMAALADDLNTPKALSELHQLANAANKATDAEERSRLKGELLAAGWLMGLLQQDPATWLKGEVAKADIDVSEIEALIKARKEARARKDWAESDRIRNDLAARGILLEDKAGETTWRVASQVMT